MDDSRLARVAGASAVLGGAAWSAAAVIHASQPRGCVGDECDSLPMRDATTSTAVLLAVAALMMVVCGIGLLLLVRRQRDLGRSGVVGAAACALGLTSLATGTGLSAVWDGDFTWMPAFVVPGVAALVAGIALVAWTVLRSGVVPAWAGIGLLVGAALLLGANEQTASVLLAVPFGVAWLAAGVTLLLPSRQEAPATADTTVPSI